MLRTPAWPAMENFSLQRPFSVSRDLSHFLEPILTPFSILWVMGSQSPLVPGGNPQIPAISLRGSLQLSFQTLLGGGGLTF